MGYPLGPFFHGLHDTLRTAMASAKDLSAASKGRSRERDVHEALLQLLPPSAHLETGDIIDANGAQTGQLDLVVVHGGGITFKRHADGPAWILAESAAAVIEVKSDLTKQWSEVESTWSKLRAIKRSTGGLHFGWGGVQDNDRSGVPLVVLALHGWETLEPLQERLLQIRTPQEPTIVVVTLDPPRIARSTTDRSEVHGYTDENRGFALASTVVFLAEWARAIGFATVPWESYLRRQ